MSFYGTFFFTSTPRAKKVNLDTVRPALCKYSQMYCHLVAGKLGSLSPALPCLQTFAQSWWAHHMPHIICSNRTHITGRSPINKNPPSAAWSFWIVIAPDLLNRSASLSAACTVKNKTPLWSRRQTRLRGDCSLLRCITPLVTRSRESPAATELLTAEVTGHDGER